MLGALGGCALVAGPQGAAAAPAAASPAVPPVSELDGFLANAQVGESRTLEFDGQLVRVTAGERYAAASGHECRRLRVAVPSAGFGEGAQQPRVACATPQGWRAPRAVLATAIGR